MEENLVDSDEILVGAVLDEGIVVLEDGLDRVVELLPFAGGKADVFCVDDVDLPFAGGNVDDFLVDDVAFDVDFPLPL